jgi:hypothetical protein
MSFRSRRGIFCTSNWWRGVRAAFRLGCLLLQASALVLALSGCIEGPLVSADTDRDNDGVADDLESARCAPASSQLLSAIEKGLTVSGGGSLSNGQIVRSDDFEQLFFVAAHIEGAGISDDIGAWATNDATGRGYIYSANALAAEFTDWGRRPGFSRSEQGLRVAKACTRD